MGKTTKKKHRPDNFLPAAISSVGKKRRKDEPFSLFGQPAAKFKVTKKPRAHQQPTSEKQGEMSDEDGFDAAQDARDESDDEVEEEEEEQVPLCTFYRKGTCRNGEDCPFRHEGPVRGQEDDDATAAVPQKMLNGVTATDLVVGTGAEARKGLQVRVKYLGRLATKEGEPEGQAFDSTIVGQPDFAFVVGDKTREAGTVVKGMDIGVVGMREGGKRRIFVPANMAFSCFGSNTGVVGGYTTRRRVPPDTDVMYELTLNTVQAAPKPKAEKAGAKGPTPAERMANPSGVRFVKNPKKDHYRSRKIVWENGIATKAPKSDGK